MRNFLFYCVVIFNACVSAGVVYAYKLGYLKLIFVSDKTGLCYAIAALFLAGLAWTMWCAFAISKSINDHRSSPYCGNRKSVAVDRLDTLQDVVFDVGEWLALMGLIGTAIGLYTAFTGGAETEQLRVGIVAAALIAFPASILGLSCMLVTRMNHKMLSLAVTFHKMDVSP